VINRSFPCLPSIFHVMVSNLAMRSPSTPESTHAFFSLFSSNYDGEIIRYLSLSMLSSCYNYHCIYEL
jgi:hypothetical protein